MKKNKMENITVIIPVNVVDEKFDDYFKNSFKSLTEQVLRPSNVMVVRSTDNKLKSYLENFDFGDFDVEVIENKGDTSFMGQINFGGENIKTKWFSILEYDDEYSKIWFKNVKEYSEYYTDVDIFLPLVVDVTEEGEFLSFTNEAVWAMNFSDKMGYLDNGCLLRYPNFQSSGVVFNKESFESIGGFKPSFKLTFVYELLLRATYNDLKVYTIPKVGYKHTNMRSGSLFWDYRYNDDVKISSDEANFWIETSKKEYFFTADRGIKYEPETV